MGFCVGKAFKARGYGVDERSPKPWVRRSIGVSVRLHKSRFSRRSFMITLALASMSFASPSPEEEDLGPGVRAMLEAIDHYQKWLRMGRIPHPRKHRSLDRCQWECQL